GGCWKNIFHVYGRLGDIAMDPQNSSTLYAAVLGYGPGDGDVWKTPNADGTLPLFGPSSYGVPASPGSQEYYAARVAVAPSRGSTVYAAFSDSYHTDLFRSLDSGATWEVRDNAMCGRQCDYNTALAALPNNPDALFYGE